MKECEKSMAQGTNRGVAEKQGTDVRNPLHEQITVVILFCYELAWLSSKLKYGFPTHRKEDECRGLS